jgi:HAMP domain-containing protein
LVVLDLHQPGSAWLVLLHLLHKNSPTTRIIISSKRPDVQRELQARSCGTPVFVRQPLTQAWMDRAIASLERPSQLTRPESGGLNSTQVRQVLGGQDKSSLQRDLVVSATNYSEILAPWEARDGQDIGLLGISLAQTFLARANQITQVQIFLLVVSALLLVILIGLMIANQITRPMLRVVDASSQVARGNLDVKIEPRGNDEVAVLARSFNTMVAGLQEGSIYRDLLGRTVSPVVREQLRHTFDSGVLRLGGQEAVATLLMTDIRGFTTLSEKIDPAEVFRWLNEYFGKLVPIVIANGGVVNKFDGGMPCWPFLASCPAPWTPSRAPMRPAPPRSISIRPSIR